jgi:hypothetical protein
LEKILETVNNEKNNASDEFFKKKCNNEFAVDEFCIIVFLVGHFRGHNASHLGQISRCSVAKWSSCSGGVRLRSAVGAGVGGGDVLRETAKE